MGKTVPASNGIEELTGFLTRKSFEHLLSDSESAADNLAVVVVELSRFGVINDSVGAGVGDRIITTLAKRADKLFKDAVGISRLHGDNFGFLFQQCADIEHQVSTILDFFQRPLVLSGEVIVLSVRIGIAESEGFAYPLKQLLHGAEVALHHAKNHNVNVSYFVDSMIKHAKSAHKLENDLRVSLVTHAAELHKAMANKEFELRYQPIISSKTNSIHAFEALMRWHHPERGMVSPALFISLAEQINLLSLLGSWIIRKACADAANWPANSLGVKPNVSINVSPTQFYEPELLFHALETAIKETNIDPKRIKIEITETVETMSSMVPHLQCIKAMGCQLSLDDFGTGYSSIAQLIELPFDYVKLDRSIIADVANSDPAKAKKSTQLVCAVLNLANCLQMTPIIEGVETVQQQEKIQSLGGDLIQGYVYSPALELDQVHRYITEFVSLAASNDNKHGALL